MNEKTTYPNEEKKLNEHTTSSSCEKTGSLYVPDANTIPATSSQPELAINASVCLDSFEKGGPETRQDNAMETQENKKGTEEGNMQLHYLSNAVMHNSFQLTDSQIKQPIIAPDVVGDMSSEGNLGGCFKEISGESEDKGVPPGIPHSVPLPVMQLNRISIAPSSHQDHKLLSEGLSFQNPVTKQDGFSQDVFAQDISAQDQSVPQATPQKDQVPILRLSRISVAPPSHQDNRLRFEELSSQDSVTKKDSFNQEVSGQEDIAEDFAVSPNSSLVCHTSTGGKAHTQICDMSFKKPPASQQLFSRSRETNGTKNVDDGVSNVTSVSIQVAAELKKPEENNKIVLSQAVLNTEKNLITDTTSGFNSSNPYGHMDEIALNDDSVEPEVEKINSASSVPQPLRVDLSKYAELLGQHKASVTFLKQSVVKGVIAGRNKLKEVVNEKLSVTNKSQESHTPNILVSAAENLPPYLSTSNNLNTATSDLSHVRASPFLSPPRSKSIPEQMFQHNIAAGFSNVTSAASVTMKDNLAQVTSSPGFADRSINQIMPSTQLTPPQLNNFNIPFHASPENRASFLHLAVHQTPGHGRRYAHYPPPYGFRIPPSLPQPPQMPAMEYFANRYCTSGHSTPASAPVIGISPPNIDRAQFGKIEGRGSPIIRHANYVTSLFHVKSNEMKDSLQKKISSSLSQTARADPDTDFFMEEGRLNRSNIPESNGPVDSCIKAMSHQMTSISLVLGIASYLVFFVLWLSLFIVAAK